MKLRRLFLFVTAAALCLSLCACDTLPDKAAASPAPSDSPAAAAASSAAASSATPVPSASAEPGKSPEVLPQTPLEEANDDIMHFILTELVPSQILPGFHTPEITHAPAAEPGEPDDELIRLPLNENCAVETTAGCYTVRCAQEDTPESADIAVWVKTPDGQELEYKIKGISWLSLCAVTENAMGEPVLMVSFDEASDDFATVFLTVQNSALEQIDQIQGNAESFKEGRLYVSDHLYLLGTRAFERSYELDETGCPVNPSDYDISMGQSVTVAKGKTLSAKTTDGASFFIPGGTVLQPMMTDYETYVTALLPDQTEIVMDVATVDYTTYICGVEENELFSDLLWAD